LQEDMLSSKLGILRGGIIAITYAPMGIRSYHLHRNGRALVPTAPREAESANSIEFASLTTHDFISSLPRLAFQNLSFKRWFPQETVVSGYSIEGDDLTIKLVQRPAIEGLNSFAIHGKITGPLSFLDGSAVLELAITDFFNQGRKLRIYHDGHSQMKMGIQHSARFNGVRCIASDGVRERILYRPNRKGLQIATLYRVSPSCLYSLFKVNQDIHTQELVREMRPDFLLGVNPLRKQEWMMLENGNAYDHGTIGAEIAYKIASQMLMTDKLLMLEPAMRGSDIVSKDRNIAIEARMLAGVRAGTNGHLKNEAVPHFRQMVGRLRWGLQRKSFKRGVAILCIRMSNQRILALTKEV